MTSYDLHITRGSFISLHSFTDVDWASSLDDKKSTSDYMVYLDSTPISLESGKQHTLTHSLTDAKYKAFTDGTAEIL